MIPSDFLGRPVEVGDEIVYPYMYGQSIRMRRATIVAIKYTEKGSYRRVQQPDGSYKKEWFSEPWFKLQVQWPERNWRTEQEEPHRAWLSKVENIVKIQEF